MTITWALLFQFFGALFASALLGYVVCGFLMLMSMGGTHDWAGAVAIPAGIVVFGAVFGLCWWGLM